MALIVEDGTGKSDAEAYGTVLEATAYHTRLGNSVAWAAVADQELAMRRGARFVDLKYELRMRGTRKLATQALAYPRLDVWTDDDHEVSPDDVPTRVMEANFEAALRAGVSGTNLMPDVAASESGSVVAEAISVGPISISEELSGGRSSEAEYKVIDRILMPLLTGVHAAERG